MLPFLEAFLEEVKPVYMQQPALKDVVVYSNTSRIAAASELFTEKYGIEVEHTN